MKKLALAALLITITSTTISAHPGRTASDGCHYCRTNCAYWGVPQDQRHCHGNNNKDQEQMWLKETAYNPNSIEHHTVNANHDDHGHSHKSTERQTEVSY